jgi:hypothetical protein
MYVCIWFWLAFEETHVSMSILHVSNGTGHHRPAHQAVLQAVLAAVQAAAHLLLLLQAVLAAAQAAAHRKSIF